MIIGAAGGTRGRSSRLFSAGGKLPSPCHPTVRREQPREEPGLTSGVSSGLSLFGTIFVEMVWECKLIHNFRNFPPPNFFSF